MRGMSSENKWSNSHAKDSYDKGKEAGKSSRGYDYSDAHTGNETRDEAYNDGVEDGKAEK
jgi:hypothetical protein